MIKGNGILATAIRTSGIDHEGCCILAAGVSNSKEDRPSAFDREAALIQSVDKNLMLVYFSTVSIYDPEKKDSPYVQHKLKMEALIKTSFPNHLILRLPIVVSAANNPNQLFGYVRSKLMNKEPLTIFRHASRYLLDIRDVPKLVEGVLARMRSQNSNQLTLDVVLGPAVNLSDLAEEIRLKLPEQPFLWRDAGRGYEVDASELQEWVEDLELISKDPKQVIVNFLEQI